MTGVIKENCQDVVIDRTRSLIHLTNVVTVLVTGDARATKTDMISSSWTIMGNIYLKWMRNMMKAMNEKYVVLGKLMVRDLMSKVGKEMLP